MMVFFRHSASIRRGEGLVKRLIGFRPGNEGLTPPGNGAGESSFYRLSKLEYLGLRGDAVTDPGIRELVELRSLTGLHLGQTGVSDAALKTITGLPNLRELWLLATAVTDSGLKKLASIKSLKRLYLQRTQTTADAVKTLRAVLPDCEIF